MAFKIGDKVRFKGEGGIYQFQGGHKGSAKKGDIFIISAVGDSKSEYGKTVYSVKGSYKQNNPNWLNMEENFELVAKSWKGMLE